MDRRVGKDGMIVEKLGRGRAVVMTPDGAFREVKLPGRLARRGAGAIGHEVWRPQSLEGSQKTPRLVQGRHIGWAAMAAVCVGLALTNPVRGRLDPFVQVQSGSEQYRQSGSEEYRLTATIQNSASSWGTSLVHTGSVRAGRTFAAYLPALPAGAAVRAAGDGFVLSPHRREPAVATVSQVAGAGTRQADPERATGGGGGTLNLRPVQAVRANTTAGRRALGSAPYPLHRPASRGWASYAGR